MTNLAHTWSEPDLYLVADEDLIHESRNIKLRLCPIQKSPEPVIVPDKPWEGKIGSDPVNSLQDPLYGTVLFDPEIERFRCWYNVYNRFSNRITGAGVAGQGAACCYAESSDGLNWEKPELGRVLHDGSPRTNMLRFSDRPTSGTSNLGEQVWNVIPYGTEATEDRFAATLMTDYGDPDVYRNGITMCFSEDGINWRMHYPPVLALDGDCHCLSWDPTGRFYILTTRSHEHANLCARWGRHWKRHIAVFKSRDLLHWTAATTVLEADDQDHEQAQLYLMYIIPYGHAYLGQLLMFYGHNLELDTQLALSRDLLHWQRVGERKPFLARGDEGAWDSKHVAITNNLPVPEGELMRFWYAGKNAPHYQAGYGALGTGTLRRDGFACCEAGDKEGVLTTIPFRPPRRGAATWLMLNVDATHGQVLAEITDLDGNPLDGVTKADCIPITGDHTRAVVNFKAEPKDYFHRGNFLRFDRDIRFRLYLRKAKLYALKIASYQPIWNQEEKP